MKKKLLSVIPLACIVLVASLLRFWQINTIAPGITIDELDYSLTAKSFYLTGTDLKNKTHTLDVLAFHYPTTDEVKAELPYLIQMPFVGPFAFSLPLTRLPFVLMSIGTVVLLYLLGKELISREAGIAAGLLGAINPFLVVIGRTSYDIAGVAFFYLFALYALIKLKGWYILLTLPLFLAAFYMYIGTKLLFIPFVLWSVGFAYFTIHHKKFLKQYITLVGIVCLFILGFITIIHSSPSSRLSEIFSPNSKDIAEQVNTIRHLSLATPLTPFIINKYTLYIHAIINSFFTIFSFDFLVGHGEWFFRLYNHGVMYYEDIIFLVVSAIFFAKKKPAVGFFLLGCIIIATFPQILHKDASEGTNYAHAALLFPFLVLCAGIGIAYLASFYKYWKKLIFLLIGFIYFFSLIYFIHAYFYQYGLQGRDEFSVRELSKYMTLTNTENKHIVVITPNPQLRFKKYLFYTNTLNKSNISQVKNAFTSSQFTLQNVRFIPCTKHPIFSKDTITIEDAECKNIDFQSHTTIALLTDGGTSYKIYNDSICGNYHLNHYPNNLKLSDLSVEKLSQQSFCEKFITR